MGEIREHIAASTLTMSKSEGRVKVVNREDETGRFVWDFAIKPAEARKLGHELIRLAGEIDSENRDDDRG